MHRPTSARVNEPLDTHNALAQSRRSPRSRDNTNDVPPSAATPKRAHTVDTYRPGMPPYTTVQLAHVLDTILCPTNTDDALSMLSGD